MKDRETWKNGLEFLFSCIGVSVGLGNIWRFPYICYKNGGGAFLVPYFLFLTMIGIPQLLLQFSYPQYSSSGPAAAWACCPLFKGIGYAMIVTNSVISLYYNVIIAWTLYYLVNSFSIHLPWTTCNNTWNTGNCYTRTYELEAMTRNTSNLLYNMSVSEEWKLETKVTEMSGDRKTATEEFWAYNVLELSDGVETMGQIRWQLLLCNFSVCLLLYLCVFKGIKLSGKIMYVAATVPYIFLTVLLVRGLMLNGAWLGLKYYFVPRWEELLRPSVWFDAAAQVIFSLGFGTADHIILASHNKFHHNIYRDAMIVPIVDAVTSLFSGCVIFVTLGYMSSTFNLDIQKVVSDGPGIAFMVFPEALSTLPLPQIWSVLFFLTLLLVGMDSRVVMVQVLTGSLADLKPELFRSRVSLTSAVVCLLTFVFGIPFIHQGGMYVLQLVDWYIASVALLLIVFLESSVLSWIYGSQRLHEDIAVMIGYHIPKLWQVFWKFVTPICILIIWIMSLVKHRPVTYGGKTYPSWSIGVGWVIALVPLLPLVGNIIFIPLQHEGNLKQRLQKSVKPLPEWRKNDRLHLSSSQNGDILLN
ncbi:sodium- and chloride-dependent GABA transporter 1-like [Ylistrum balloti]|uniref:sodium- and chloride-dependent GABA transporter 1-like n=1 Tax=Ylistrum balloti TaxID=509963 RepID=UPI0029059BCD|nr:sodium- and chloride-dependent GABA transporter 1-like [Ylistrum balloti]